MQPQNGHHESPDGSGNGFRAPGLDLRHLHVFKYTYLSWPRMGSTLRRIYMAIAVYAAATEGEEELHRQIAELREQNARLQEENAQLRGRETPLRH